MPEFNIGRLKIGLEYCPIFIADIGANHDGDLSRAKMLIEKAAAAGADVVKFQNFIATNIVSRRGFADVGRLSHQSSWSAGVYETYEEYSINRDWIPILHEHCQSQGVEFMSTPYDIDSADLLLPYVSAYKIGSGDITYTRLISHIAKKGLPILLSTGASTMEDVNRAVLSVAWQVPLVIMQCNTDYTGIASYKHLNLNVISMYLREYPKSVVGISDHSTDDIGVLVSISLGARVVEKHFSDDTTRVGPDHKFSVTPDGWTEMVRRAKNSFASLGSDKKFVCDNESETVVIQRRCLRLSRDMSIGEIVEPSDLVPLRPAPVGSIPPYMLNKIIGHTVNRNIAFGEHITQSDIL